MINKRSTLIVIFFLAMTLTVFFMAQDVKKKKEKYSDLLDVEIVDESKFKNMTYFALSGGEKYLNLESAHLTIINQKDFIFHKTSGEVFGKDNRKTLFKADSGQYLFEDKKLSLNSNIDFKMKDANYKADNISYSQKREELIAIGNVEAYLKDLDTDDELIIKANKMDSDIKSKITRFQGNVDGQLIRKRRYEGGFSFGSENMTLKQLESLIELSKDVNLRRNNYDVEAQKAEIFLENYNKRLKYYVLYDDIKFVEKLKLRSGKTQVRRAYAEKLEGFMSQAKIILSGAPRVEQGGDLIKGYEITLRENVELVEVDDSQSSFQLKRK